jgi:pyruvate dehydrogenase E2 component (dihydrolipoamide acetyltransferase)
VATLTEIVVPDIGDFRDVPVIEILVGPGDTVAPEDPLVTLESDKATMDVPAPFPGVVQQLLVKVGDTVSQGTPIVTLAPPNGAEAAALAPEAAQPGAPESDGAPPPPAPPAATAATPPEAARMPADAIGAPPGAPAAAGSPPYASPTVRRLARELGVDLRNIEGTGRKGRILKQDVEAAAGAPSAGDGARPAAVPGAVLDIAPWPQVDFARYGPIERVALSRIKRLSGPNLHRNWVMIPHVTQHDEADVTELEAFRVQVNQAEAKAAGVKVTMVALLLKACVAALREFPDFNASLDGDELVRKHYYHLGFAADTPQGLLVPVIRDVDKKGLLELARELSELSGKAREGKLGPAEMSGGTFSISSLGGIGGTGFTPIINAPEVAILGVARAATKPVWNGTEFVPRLMMPLSLSYDHRVIDGAAAARFVVYLAAVLADLRRVLL